MDDDDDVRPDNIGVLLLFLLFLLFFHLGGEREGRDGSRSDLINLHRHTSKKKTFLCYCRFSANRSNPSAALFFISYLGRGYWLEGNESREGQKHDN